MTQPELSIATIGEPNADKAKRYREELRRLLEPVMDVLNKAARDGMRCGFNIADTNGLRHVAHIEVVKVL
jgi:hypothetical protein